MQRNIVSVLCIEIGDRCLDAIVVIIVIIVIIDEYHRAFADKRKEERVW